MRSAKQRLQKTSGSAVLQYKEKVMYEDLFNEIEAIQKSWDYGFLEALGFIVDMEDQYSFLVRTQLRQFLNEGF
jgi:hypothetical protein